MMKMITYWMAYLTKLVLFGGIFVLALIYNIAYATPLVVYTDRSENLIKPLIDRFQAKEKIEVKTYYGSSNLFEKLKQEGGKSPADIVYSTNSVLNDQLHTSRLIDVIPQRMVTLGNEKFVGNDKTWMGVSYRLRVVVVKNGSSLPPLQSFWDLAKPVYKNKICIRDGLHIYNLDLFSQMKNERPDAIGQFLKDLKANLARKPQGNDRDQVKAVVQDICELAIVNNYYLGLLLTEIPDLTKKITITTPTLGSMGYPIAVSAVSVMKSSKNKEDAYKFIAYLLSPEAQKYFSIDNFELPVQTHTPLPDLNKNLLPSTMDTKNYHFVINHRIDIARELLQIRFNE
ncbi:MAG: extracellular solute-binding protein [Gammaproteobacteria bacterium]|nr:extracellular solute-binding protein [Gammaproteobacteria bacterium]